MSDRAMDLDDAQPRLGEVLDEAPARSEDGIPIPRAPRVFGSARGLFRIADDFDAPLDEFREYM
jgi:hypothetical protein